MSPQVVSRTPESHADRPSPATGWVVAASIVAFVGYFVLLHRLIVRGDAPWLAVAMVVAPWFVAAGSLGRRTTVAVATAVAAGAIVVASSDGPARSAARWGAALAAHVDVLLFVENGIFLVALCTMFARSLRGPGDALVTRLARRVRRDDMPPPVVRYTRAVTAAWAIFFAAAALVSAALFASQSRAAWSGFVNLLLWPLTGAMFAVEYAVRVRVLRDVTHVPMTAGIAAFRRRDRLATVESASPPP